GGADGARQAPGEERVCVAAGEGVDEILKGLRIRDEHREQIPLTVAVDYILSLASILSATEPPSPCVPTGSCPSPLRQECASSSRLRGAPRRSTALCAIRMRLRSATRTGQRPFATGSRIGTHSICDVIGKMSAWTQAGKPQVRDACGSRMRAAGRPERQMSVTALHRFGADNLARHAYLRSASPGTEPHVGGVTSVRPVRTRGSPLKGQCDRNSLTRPLRAWEACPACCTPPGDGATYFDHPGHEHAV